MSQEIVHMPLRRCAMLVVMATATTDMTQHRVNVPEVTWCFVTGTGIFQAAQFDTIDDYTDYSNNPEANAAAIRLGKALVASKSVKMGKGHTNIVITDKAALEVLWGYMDVCEDGAYYGDGPSSETYGAIKVKQRIEKILGFAPSIYTWNNGVKS